MDAFIHCFVPIFVAMDIAGLLATYLNLTRSMEAAAREKTVIEAVGTAFVISVAFVFIGQWMFELLRITVQDFQVAGGLLLLVLAIVDMLRLGELKLTHAHIGPVPLGIPLMVGPAVLTSLLVLLPIHGYRLTLLGLGVNLLLALLALRFSRFFGRVIGEEGLRVLSQVISLFLAAIGVSLIRQGIFR